MVSHYEIHSNCFLGRRKMQFIVFFYPIVMASLPKGWLLYQKSIWWNAWEWQYSWIIRIMSDTHKKSINVIQTKFFFSVCFCVFFKLLKCVFQRIFFKHLKFYFSKTLFFLWEEGQYFIPRENAGRHMLWPLST